MAIISNHTATWCITLHHLYHPTLWPSHSIHNLHPTLWPLVSKHMATWCITLHHLHHQTLWPLKAFMLQHDASPYIISIIQHYGHHTVFMPQHDASACIIFIMLHYGHCQHSCCNMIHHPTSSPSSNIMVIYPSVFHAKSHRESSRVIKSHQGRRESSRKGHQQ